MSTNVAIPAAPAIEAQALARHVRMSPQKARLVVDLIRGQRAESALHILRYTKKRAARDVEKVLRSAIANAENSAGGFGVTPAIAEDLFALGLDVLTSGNHIWDKREIYDYLSRTPRLLRPHNYPPDSPGTGLAIVKQCAILNLQGRTYMPNTDCPFRAADQSLAGLDPAIKVRFVDFHAEVTSETAARTGPIRTCRKVAMSHSGPRLTKTS